MLSFSLVMGKYNTFKKNLKDEEITEETLVTFEKLKTEVIKKLNSETFVRQSAMSIAEDIAITKKRITNAIEKNKEKKVEKTIETKEKVEKKEKQEKEKKATKKTKKKEEK